jgi:(p)ppGpp synthase/HD superfamily hydrolase
MIYTPMTKRAIEFAFDAHRGQYDKSGLPYITHPLHVAEQMDTEDECVVALLHDVLEDTDFSAEDMSSFGFSDRQITALKLLCHDDAVHTWSMSAKSAPTQSPGK